MIKTIEPQKVDGVPVPRHTIEVLCPNCGRDVDEQELAALKCNDCGQDLTAPQQSVAIHVTSIPTAGVKTWGQ